MAKRDVSDDGELDSIERTLREITHVPDGRIVKALKGVLERQSRFVRRIIDLERSMEMLRDEGERR